VIGRTNRVVLLLAIALASATLLAYRTFARAAGEPLAETECPFRGPPRVTVNAGLAAEDSMPVRLHEEVHAAQCRELGPVRYRIRNLTGGGKLSLEVPAYCAGARGRLAMRQDSVAVRVRLVDDAQAAFANIVDSARVRAALRAKCPDLVPQR
jgi:hypothetical protein